MFESCSEKFACQPQTFAGAAGALTDHLGLEAMYAAFVFLAAVCPPLALKTLPVSVKRKDSKCEGREVK